MISSDSAGPIAERRREYWVRALATYGESRKIRQRSSTICRKNAAPRIKSGRSELFLDANKLIVLRQTIRAGEAPGLDLSAIGGDREIGNRRIFGLAGPMRHHRSVAGALRNSHSLERLRQG